MGAETFHDIVSRDERTDTALKAFKIAVDNALYEQGHSGYTGSIAEKHTFDVIRLREGETVQDCIDRTIDNKFDDKWGPAGCIVTPHEYHFYGWASS